MTLRALARAGAVQGLAFLQALRAHSIDLSIQAVIVCGAPRAVCRYGGQCVVARDARDGNGSSSGAPADAACACYAMAFVVCVALFLSARIRLPCACCGRGRKLRPPGRAMGKAQLAHSLPAKSGTILSGRRGPQSSQHTPPPRKSGGVTVRRYAAATDNGASLVSSNVSAALQPWAEALEVTTNHMFDYFTGNGNAEGANLSAYVTAPLMFRPASDTRPWFVDMVLQPSAWPAKSRPPRPARGFVVLSPFGPLEVAVLHRVVKTPPVEADFEACDAALRAVVASSSSWTVNVAGPHTPTFAFYFPRDDGLLPTHGPYDIECWVEVSAT